MFLLQYCRGLIKEISPIMSTSSTPAKKGKVVIVCEVDYDCVLSPYKEVYVPKLGLKKDLGIEIIGVKDVKAVSFWVDNVPIFLKCK